MRLGLCCSESLAPAAIAAGFDFVELPAVSLGADYIPHVEATNLFFPGDFQLYQMEPAVILGYAVSRIERATQLGVKVMVVGSGQARHVPDEYDPDDCFEAFIDLMGAIQKIASPYDIVIAAEQLNSIETNLGTDAVELRLALGEKDLDYTFDLYHVLREHPSVLGEESFWRAMMNPLPAHVHLSNRERKAPNLADPEVVHFLSKLKEYGYDGRISLECKDIRTVDDVRRAYAQAQTLF